MSTKRKRPNQSPSNGKGPARLSKSYSKKKKKKDGTASRSSASLNWLDNLVQQSASGNDTQIMSKEDRMRKRNAKKERREQQKQQSEQPQQHQKQQQSRIRDFKKQSEFSSTKGGSGVCRRRLAMIASTIDRVRQELYGQGDVRPRLYDTKVAALANKKSRKRQQWSEESIQPRSSDYSGIGLARTSMYIEFLDPSCLAKLQEEFQEHIPGFFGKQRTKAMKKQSDGNMLWRQLADKKQNMSKKLQAMHPDQRVQAMIDAGMI